MIITSIADDPSIPEILLCIVLCYALVAISAILNMFVYIWCRVHVFTSLKLHCVLYIVEIIFNFYVTSNIDIYS